MLLRGDEKVTHAQRSSKFSGARDTFSSFFLQPAAQISLLDIGRGVLAGNLHPSSLLRN